MRRTVLVVVLVILIAFIGVFSLFKEELLMPVITNLVRGDALTKADLIVALGGETFRKKEAQKLFKEGYAKKILFTGFDIEREDYKRYGFKDNEYVYPVKTAFNTYEEALFVKEVAKKYNFKSIIVVTAFYHSHRTSYIFKKLLENEGVKVMVYPVFYKDFELKNWWKNRYLLKVVIIEWLGLLYYHLEY